MKFGLWISLVLLSFVFLSLPLSLHGAVTREPIVVGSKIFTESFILGEIAAQVMESAGTENVSRKLGMGSTGILFESLKSGAIDLYPDYTGTLAEAILKNPSLKSETEIRRALAPLGLVISRPLGFNNTYALAVTEAFAVQNNLRSIQDLGRVQSQIKAAFSYEFMDRQDGYRGLLKHYRLQLPPKNVSRMEHSLAYRAIEDGTVNLIEVYSTDAKIRKLRLRLLEDDRSYFPVYQAVWVARAAFVEKYPGLWQALAKYEGAIQAPQMQVMNAEADIEKIGFEQIAARFLGKKSAPEETKVAKIWRRTLEHLGLVGAALLFSILVGVPLGFVSARYHLVGQTILLTSGLFQTIPSLALLCFLIPVFGVGATPALVALCLYSLLPVVMNTFIGIRSIEARHLENARAYGLTKRQILFRIIFPLASPTILAGVKTATIVSIGTATLAALVGAGGYGVSIVSGLSLNDVPTILTGAVPAAVMALFSYVLFDLLGRLLIPAGLRNRS